MAIVTFCSNEIKETGQTLSLAAIVANMAIEHNYKILTVSTNFNDLTLENCFWEYDKIRKASSIELDSQGIALEAGVEGLIKALASNRASSEIIKSYSRSVLKDGRLDILLSPTTKSYQEYTSMAHYYNDILSIANKYYDFVFVDLSKKMPRQDAGNILQASDIVVVNLIQRLRTIDNFMALRNSNDFYRRKNVMLAIGRYDKFSKYNSKNITRYLKEKKELSIIPYNTLFFEACSEGTIIDFFLKTKDIIDKNDRNVKFVKDIETACNNIIYKFQELQMKM